MADFSSPCFSKCGFQRIFTKPSEKFFIFKLFSQYSYPSKAFSDRWCCCCHCCLCFAPRHSSKWPSGSRESSSQRPPALPIPSHPHLSGQLAQFPSIYLSSIHPCIHTDHFRHVRRQPKVRSSVVRLAKSLAYLCVCCVGWCVSVCLLVNLSFSFSFNFLLFFWAYHPLATHLPVSFVCGLPLCEITKGLLSRFLRLLTV